MVKWCKIVTSVLLTDSLTDWTSKFPCWRGPMVRKWGWPVANSLWKPIVPTTRSFPREAFRWDLSPGQAPPAPVRYKEAEVPTFRFFRNCEGYGYCFKLLNLWQFVATPKSGLGVGSVTWIVAISVCGISVLGLRVSWWFGSDSMFSPSLCTCGQGRPLETFLENEKEAVTEDIILLTEKLERQQIQMNSMRRKQREGRGPERVKINNNNKKPPIRKSKDYWTALKWITTLPWLIPVELSLLCNKPWECAVLTCLGSS